MTRLATGGKHGMYPPVDDRICFNRTGAAATAGQLLLVDTRRSQAESVNAEHGFEDSAYAQMIIPAGTIMDRIGFYAIVLKGAADNQKILCRFHGRAAVNVDNDAAATDAAAGEPFYMDTAANPTMAHVTPAATPASKKILGILQGAATQNTQTLGVDADIWGISGIGHT